MPGEEVSYSFLLTSIAGGVDGRAARNLSEIRTIAGVDSYQVAAGLVAMGSDLAATDYLMEKSGGFRASAHIPDGSEFRDVRANVGELILYIERWPRARRRLQSVSRASSSCSGTKFPRLRRVE